MSDTRIFVEADYNPDDVRTFYEIPDQLAAAIRNLGKPEWTFNETLAHLFGDWQLLDQAAEHWRVAYAKSLKAQETIRHMTNESGEPT